MFFTLRLFFVLCAVVVFPITHAVTDASVVDPFDVTPCVWRSFDSTSFCEIQQRLRREVIGSPECHPHNRAVVTLMVFGEGESVFSIDLVCGRTRVFQSNYVYPLSDEATGCDKSRVEGEFKVARKEFTTSAGAIGATDDVATLTRLFSENRQKLVVLERHTATLESMRVLEADYNAFYPFHDSNYRSRLLDAESSICMLIENKLRSRVIDLSSARSISLHMHSDNNLCFIAFSC